MTSFDKMLVMRRYLVTRNEDAKDKNSYLNAYLLANFGIVVDKPQLLTSEMVKSISKVYKLEVPESFYKNPQDTKYFTCSELLLEQLVSYFLVETGTGIYDRVELFHKELPQYVVGDEIKLREFKIITAEEAVTVLKDIAKAYCDYTRPFSEEEVEEFKLLFKDHFIDDDWNISCKDNIFNLLEDDINFARLLDKKDLVKLSIKYFGEKSDNLQSVFDKSGKKGEIIAQALFLVRNCQMTKKQAKYFNKLLSLTNSKAKRVEANSPQKRAMALLREHKVVEAANIFAKNGSLLERNLRMLLSRANPQEALEIINMIKAKNPIVLFQLVNSLEEEAGKPRTFTFTTNNKVKKHKETEYETKWRKSRLSSGTVKFLHEMCVKKVYEYYESLPTLGKVYIGESFYRLGLPTNTSANGKGIDALPTGSRILCTGTAIRTFVTWKGTYDIDSSLTLVKEDGKTDYIYFGNYSSKPVGNDILFSGDDRSDNGTEYYDIKLEEMRRRGYKYIIQSFHGYAGRLDEGEIYCGYQNKDNLNTRAWDPKNVEMQFRVHGDSRACLALAIDLTTKEVIVLNLIVNDESQVVNRGNLESISKYLNPNFLEISMGGVIEHRGVRVDKPEDADIVFDNEYTELVADGEQPRQKIVRSYELEKLVSIANGK